jgi:deoxyadenosine/deoxycytidine kinase
MPIITIDGNIGCGKSTILNYLHKTHKIAIDLEPVEKWKVFLKNMYENKKNIFDFQLRVWLDRSWIQEKEEKILILMERSPFFVKNTFILSAYQNNYINKNEYDILIELYNKTDNIWNSNKYIYLQSDPEKCLERIKQRGRECEATITTEFVNNIHKLHEDNYNLAIKENKDIIVINIEDKEISEIANLILAYI